MDYKQTLDYLFARLPMFQRIGQSAYKADLNNTIRLMEALDNPQHSFKSIHIGGTNGKGSTSHLLASILTEKGYKTGLHTSPHLKDFRERIRVNGVMCDEGFVVDFVSSYRDVIEEIEPSFFELSVAMAFKYFERERVDIAVVEVGMGGRLDSTNMLSPMLSIITNISYDHTQFLGGTLAEIAVEKAGIIKPDTDVVIGQTQDETTAVFVNKAKHTDSRIVFADRKYEVRNVRNGERLVVDVYRNKELAYKDLEIPLCGDYQQRNIVTVVAAVEQLNCDIDEDTLRAGIMNLQTNAPLFGRWQKLADKPLTICDTGHNEDGLRYVCSQLKKLSCRRLHIVFGVVNDKDLTRVFPLLPTEATYYLCKADIPRGLEAEKLADKFDEAGGFSDYDVYPSVKDALNAAQARATDDDVIFVGGSTFTVAEVI
ncbi:MAG: bifunctional folylpolyglutamate synthase/dihydrofolate synthase [Bacteroidales bacterium]|nr:bifunctional folylpolyglutamate synthase/dihydrofolate synthase [Bacteroidales bacterium]